MNGEAANRQVLCEIAHTAFEVVSRLLARDQLLARNLRSETTTSRQVYREECITVEVATTLIERIPQRVQMTLFTPPEETQSGADWYWRIERGDQAIHAFVQAKRVQRTQFGQPDHGGRVDIDLPQLRRLIEATEAASSQSPGLQAWFATFARFEATPPCGESYISQCQQHRHGGECAPHQPSLWIAHASELRDLGRTLLSVREVVERSIRLDCILPCISAAGSNKGPAAKGFSLATGLPRHEDCIDGILRDPALLKSFAGALRILV